MQDGYVVSDPRRHRNRRRRRLCDLGLDHRPQRGQGPLGLILGLLLGPIGVLIAVLLPEAEKPRHGYMPERYKHYSPSHHKTEEDMADWLDKM